MSSGVISATLVRRSQKPFYCLDGSADEHLRNLPVGSTYVRLYGSAHGEKPWVLPLCIPCASLSPDVLVVAALDGLRDPDADDHDEAVARGLRP